jgi:hypothetical protein
MVSITALKVELYTMQGCIISSKNLISLEPTGGIKLEEEGKPENRYQ